MSREEDAPTPSLLSLGWRFFAIGCVAFGGFMALISVVEDVFVRQLGWIEREDMLDGISLANVLPGPQAVNTVTYVGYRIAGLMGALVSFVAILTPTFVLVTVLTFLYFSFAQDVVWLKGLFKGFNPGVAAVIFAVVKRLRAKAVTSQITWTIAIIASVVLVVTPASIALQTNLMVLGLAGVAGAFLLKPEGSGDPSERIKLPWARVGPLFAIPVALLVVYLLNPPLANGGLAHLTLTFSGLSVMLFGGGYVFIPMLEAVVVGQEGWLLTQQFNDGIAFSQITPGPIMITAAFVGQKVMMTSHGPFWGILGGLLCTLGIFGPPALVMVGASQMLDAIRTNRTIQGALKGLRAAVVGMIFVAGWSILKTDLPPLGDGAQWLSTGLPVLTIFSAAMVALIRFKMSVLLVLPVCGVLGVFLL